MKTKIWIALSVAVCQMTLFTACDDNKKEFLDDYSTVLYFLNSGVQPLTLYKTGESTIVRTVINKAGSDLNSKATAHVALLAETWLNDYNMENGTAYKCLPAHCYTLPTNTSFEFSGKKDTYKTLDVVFDPDAIYELDTKENYVLPLGLTSTDSVNVAKNELLYFPTVNIPTVYFGKTGYTRNDFADGGAEEMNFSLPLMMSILNKWNFTCKVEVDPTLLDEYNAQNDLNYRLLPGTSYAISGSGTVTYTEADQSKSLEISVNNKQLNYGNYVLPLRLIDCTKEGFLIDVTKNACLYGISYIPDINKLNTVPLTVSMLSSNAEEPYEGSLTNLLDGDPTTYFHSAYSWTVGASHHLQVNLGKEYTAFTFSFTTRHNNNTGNPTSIILYGSTDGTTFTKIDQITEGLPTTGLSAIYNSELFVAQPFSHLRLVMPVNRGGSPYFVFSAFSMKGL